MQLFERVRLIAQERAGSETKLAEKLSLSQKKFNWYMKPNSEKNLWQYLPNILECYPEISRDWLYFGEGEMLASTSGAGMKPVAIFQTAAARLQENAPSEREMALEEKIASLQTLLASKEETIASQKETIATQKQMMRQALIPLGSPDPAQADGLRVATDTPALGAHTSMHPKGER